MWEYSSPIATLNYCGLTSTILISTKVNARNNSGATPLGHALRWRRTWPTNPRVYLILVSAGAEVPEAYHPYIERIIDAGDWETYRRHHLDQLTAMLTPKDQTDGRRRSRRRLSPLRHLPPEILRRIVAYAYHAGYY